MQTTKTAMIEELTEAIGPLDFTEVEEAQAAYNNVREQISQDEAEAEILETAFKKLSQSSMAERLGTAAAAGRDLDKVQAAPDEMRSRLAKVHHRIEILQRELRKYESKIQLAREEILARVEGAVDKIRGDLSPELVKLLQKVETFQADWASALKEVLAKDRMTPLSLRYRTEASLAIFPPFDGKLLPYTLTTLPKILAKQTGLALESETKKE